MALPLDVLEKSLNQKLSLLLKDGRVIEGKLTGYNDRTLKIVLDEEDKAVIPVDIQIKNIFVRIVTDKTTINSKEWERVTTAIARLY